MESSCLTPPSCVTPLEAVSTLTVDNTFSIQMHVAPAGSEISQSVILSNGTVLLVFPASVHAQPHRVGLLSLTNRIPSTFENNSHAEFS
jgi:hypothetical protein